MSRTKSNGYLNTYGTHINALNLTPDSINKIKSKKSYTHMRFYNNIKNWKSEIIINKMS